MSTITVRLQTTQIKYLDPETEQVHTINRNEKVNVADSKALVRELDPKAVYVSKETATKILTVNAEDLLSIAIEETE